MAFDPEAYAAELRSNQAAYQKLTRELEEMAARNPKVYRQRVWRLAALGYLYIYGVLALILAAILGIVALMAFGHRFNFLSVKAMIFLVPVAYAIVKALAFRPGMPTGVELSHPDAPQLWGEVDAMSRLLQAAKVDRIVVDDEFNLAAVQTPTLGMFGPSRNTLVLGLPFMLTMTPDELKAGIAHELGHFSGNHGRFGGRIYRLAITWERLHLQFQQQGSWLFRSFFNWFVPKFNATTFALRRQNEYEADGAAREIAGAESLARLLFRVNYMGSYLSEHVWDPIKDRAKVEPQAPPRLMELAASKIPEQVDADYMGPRIRAALATPTGYADTHPSLRDRLASIGIRPEEHLTEWMESLQRPVTPNSAQVFFGSGLPAIMQRVDQTCLTWLSEGWPQAYAHFSEQRGIYQRLQEKPSAELSPDEQLELAALIEVFDGKEAALERYSQLVELFPDRADVNYRYGAALLKKDREEGVGYLERARDIEPRLQIHVLEEIAEYQALKGNQEAVASTQEAAYAAMANLSAHSRELEEVGPADDFLPPNLTPEQRTKLTSQLEGRRDYQQIFIAARQLKSNPLRPVHYIIAIPRVRFAGSYEGVQNTLSTFLIEKVTYDMEAMIIVPAQKDVKAWRKRLEAIPESLLAKS